MSTLQMPYTPNSGLKTALEKFEKALFIALVAFAIGLMIAVCAHAGTDSTFTAPVTWLSNTLTGSLGKTLALGSLAVGLGIGLVQQSVMSVAVGTAVALAASVGPGVLTGIVGAAL